MFMWSETPLNPEDEVLVLRNEQDVPELIVQPYPATSVTGIFAAEAGESIEDKERKLIDGIRTHYAVVAALAETEARGMWL